MQAISTLRRKISRLPDSRLVIDVISSFAENLLKSPIKSLKPYKPHHYLMIKFIVFATLQSYFQANEDKAECC
tara:strand:+ start:338 stop:556 length:219 start_codon:yes stop_codon:yes gene_type:complete